MGGGNMIGNMGGMMGGFGDMEGMDMDGKMRGAMDTVKGGMNKVAGKGMGMIKAIKKCMCEQCQREESCAMMSEESKEESKEEEVDCEVNKYVVLRRGAKTDKKGKKAVTKKTKKIAKAVKKWQKAVDKGMKKVKQGKTTKEEVEAAADEKSFKKFDMEDVKAYRVYKKCMPDDEK